MVVTHPAGAGDSVGTSTYSAARPTPESILSHSDKPHPGRIISGVVCASIVVVAIICAVLWLVRRRLVKYCSIGRSNSTTISMSDDFSIEEEVPASRQVGNEAVGVKVTNAASNRERYQREDSQQVRLHRQSLDASQTAPGRTILPQLSNQGLRLTGIREPSRLQLNSVELDPLPTKPASQCEKAPSTPARTQKPTGAARAASMNRPLPKSPSVSSVPTPITPITDSTFSPVSCMTTFSPNNAYTPSIYQPQPPTSLPHTRGTIPYAERRQELQPPPSLPQPYSIVSLGSTAELYRRLNSSINLYQGLSTRDGEVEQPPWAYMSAEEAIGGGWRNSISTDKS